MYGVRADLESISIFLPPKMPETARAHPVRSIRRPEFSPTRHNGRRDEEDAAWFYEGIYTLNREINVTLHTKWIAGEWRRRAVSLYTDTKKAKAMSNELLTPRVRRLVSDLHIVYAMFKCLDETRPGPITRVASIDAGRKADIRLAYGRPGELVNLPFYLHYTPHILTYEWLIRVIRIRNPNFEMNKARADQIFTHIFRSEFGGISEKRADSNTKLLQKVST